MTLEWNRLLNPARRKTLDGSPESMKTGVGRQELERDYDRILFATPTRRLANKTQVFPLEENAAIRNRLTHSHEVSNLARSIGVRIAFEHPDQVFKNDHEKLQVKRNVPALLAAVGLAHDLGNPPFGHQGEVAIREWFEESEYEIERHDDFLKFDGNAQTFRLLTRLQVLNDEFGLNLTVATLAALMKYPSFHDSRKHRRFKKFGIFQSEKEIAREVWKETGLDEGVRHPLAYIMEACDDIAYSVIDAEDTVKKNYASYYDLIDYLESEAGNDEAVLEILEASRKKNEEFKKEFLSSRELSDISMQMFRVKAIAEMIVAVTDVFVKHVDAMMSGDVSNGFELVENSRCAVLCSTLKEFDRRYGFQHTEVLKLELEGNNYIKGMMHLLWQSISRSKEERTLFQQYAYGKISENYRRVYESSHQTKYDKQRLLCDTISGMTEQFLIKEYVELKGLLDGPA